MSNTSPQEKVIVTGVDANTVRVALGYLGVHDYEVETIIEDQEKEELVLGYASLDDIKAFAEKTGIDKRNDPSTRIYYGLYRCTRDGYVDISMTERLARPWGRFGTEFEPVELFKPAPSFDDTALNLDTLHQIETARNLMQIPNFGKKTIQFIHELLESRRAEIAEPA